MKTRVLETIGETAFARPAKVNAALAANDRVKYYFSVLQMAADHARHPNGNAETLARERVAAGVTDVTWDDIIAKAQPEGNAIRIPGCKRLIEEVMKDVGVMAEPVRDTYAERLETLSATLPQIQDDLIDPSAIQKITRAGRADSLHQFVMDVHKSLNAMQKQLAEERISGAAVYHIRKSDRPLIAAFMTGLNRTANLKFNHPGLETTATRSGTRLIIQNDIGTTDAHVLVIHVEERIVELTYTDVHPERIKFLQGMLRSFAVSWGDGRSMRADSLSEEDSFHLTTARFEAKDDAELRAYLEFLGSRIVFLIDWNRARKQLRGFVRSEQRIELLHWAAESDIGHRGFLQMGGAALVNNAIEEIAGSAMHFGDRLCDVLGDDSAMEFLRFVFRTATEGLLQLQSVALVQGRIEAELQAHFSSEEKRLLQLAAEHGGLIFEIASLARDGIRGSVQSGERPEELARRARKFEHDADQLVVSALEATRKRPEYTSLFRLIETADDAADELEEVAFLLGLLGERKGDGKALEDLAALADLLVASAQEWIKALSHAAQLERRGGASARVDAEDFLTAIDRVFALEHQADDAERALKYTAVQQAGDFRHLHVYSEMGGSLEAAADTLKSAGLMARDYLMGSLLRA